METKEEQGEIRQKQMGINGRLKRTQAEIKEE